MPNALNYLMSRRPQGATLSVFNLLIAAALLFSYSVSTESQAQTLDESETEWVESTVLWQAHVDDINEQLTAPEVNHCEGLISHTNPVTVSPISQSPHMNLYLDPAFNTRNRRITNSQAQQVHRPMSNFANGWNNDESLLILQRFDKASSNPKFVLMDGNNYQILGDLNIPTVASNTVYWSQYNPLSVFYVDNHEHAGQLKRFDIASGTQEVVADFTPLCESHGFEANGGIFTKPSMNDELFAYRCGVKDNKSLLVTYEYTNDEYHSLQIGSDTQWDVNSPLYAMPNGDGYWMQDTQLSNTLELYTGARENNPLEAPNGVKISPYEQSLSNWFALSSMGHGKFENFVTEQPAPTYFSEIILAKVQDASVLDMCRVAHHRSFGTAANNSSFDKKLAETSAILSPSGSRILFNSDWYDNGSVDTYAIELPSFTRLQLDGQWADKQQPSMITRIAQAGSRFAYSRALVSDNESPVITTGTGRINGRSIDLEYVTKVSDKRVTGKCIATIQNDINDIAFECEDEHFGVATYNLIRQ